MEVEKVNSGVRCTHRRGQPCFGKSPLTLPRALTRFRVLDATERLLAEPLNQKCSGQLQILNSHMKTEPLFIGYPFKELRVAVPDP